MGLHIRCPYDAFQPHPTDEPRTWERELHLCKYLLVDGSKQRPVWYFHGARLLARPGVPPPPFAVVCVPVDPDDCWDDGIPELASGTRTDRGPVKDDPNDLNRILRNGWHKVWD